MVNKKQEPKIKEPKIIKADDFVGYEGIKEKEAFTNFQELLKKVEILQENMDEIAGILRANDLTRKKEIEAPYFDLDNLYDRLEEDD